MYIITTLVYMHISMKKYKFCEKSIDQIKNAPPESFSAHTDKLHTLLTLLRIPFLGRIGSISYVLPIRQNIDILNRDSRVHFLSAIVYKQSSFATP